MIRKIILCRGIQGSDKTTYAKYKSIIDSMNEKL